MYLLTFFLNSANVDFTHYVPIVKIANCKQYKCEQSWVEFNNRHLMSEVNISRIWERK